MSGAGIRHRLHFVGDEQHRCWSAAHGDVLHAHAIPRGRAERGGDGGGCHDNGANPEPSLRSTGEGGGGEE